MASAQVKLQESNPVVKLPERDCFGAPVYKENFKLEDYKPTFIKEYGLELDKETGNTKVIVANEIDIDQEILAALPSSGLAGLAQAIRTGQCTPRDVMDDDGQFQDFSDCPDNVNDAYRQTLDASAASKEVVDGLGINPNTTYKQIEEAVNKALNEAVAKMQAAKPEGDSNGSK